MYALINSPGSQSFDWYGPADKAECQEWLEAKRIEYQDRFGGAWVGAYQPARIITNRDALAIRYRDGKSVIREPDCF